MEFGLRVALISRCDSSAARGALQRTGTGRMKHLEVKHLWVQDLVLQKRLSVQWVPRSQNPSDMLTHPVSASDLKRHVNSLGARVRSNFARGGRPAY